MADTLVRFDTLTRTEVPRCDIPEEDILRILRAKMHTASVHTEPGKEMVIEVLLPFFELSEIFVDADNGWLSIHVERHSGQEEQKYTVRGCSSFRRSFALPLEAKDRPISAELSEGRLRVTIPLV